MSSSKYKVLLYRLPQLQVVNSYTLLMCSPQLLAQSDPQFRFFYFVLEDQNTNLVQTLCGLLPQMKWLSYCAFHSVSSMLSTAPCNCFDFSQCSCQHGGTLPSHQGHASQKSDEAGSQSRWHLSHSRRFHQSGNLPGVVCPHSAPQRYYTS